MKRCLFVALLAACDTTGGRLVTFDVAAAGPEDATGGPRAFENGLGWHVILTRATLHIGAVYLNLASPISGAQGTNCILPGIYTAEELSAVDISVLSNDPQPFPRPADGTDDAAETAEIWLTGGDVNAAEDPTVIADIQGAAVNGAMTIGFTATITIGSNRLVASSDPSMPSAHPICKQRIVSPIPVDIKPQPGGQLLIRIDPDLWFADVDFSQLPEVSPGKFAFPDDLSIPASQNLFTNLRAGADYELTFR
jgi:hypothetical protein